MSGEKFKNSLGHSSTDKKNSAALEGLELSVDQIVQNLDHQAKEDK